MRARPSGQLGVQVKGWLSLGLLVVQVAARRIGTWETCSRSVHVTQEGRSSHYHSSYDR